MGQWEKDEMWGYQRNLEQALHTVYDEVRTAFGHAGTSIEALKKFNDNRYDWIVQQCNTFGVVIEARWVLQSDDQQRVKNSVNLLNALHRDLYTAAERSHQDLQRQLAMTKHDVRIQTLATQRVKVEEEKARVELEKKLRDSAADQSRSLRRELHKAKEAIRKEREVRKIAMKAEEEKARAWQEQVDKLRNIQKRMAKGESVDVSMINDLSQPLRQRPQETSLPPSEVPSTRSPSPVPEPPEKKGKEPEINFQMYEGDLYEHKREIVVRLSTRKKDHLVIGIHKKAWKEPEFEYEAVSPSQSVSPSPPPLPPADFGLAGPPTQKKLADNAASYTNFMK